MSKLGYYFGTRKKSGGGHPEATRASIPILDRLQILAEAGITYFEAHDSEIPFDQVEAGKRRADECD